MAEMKWFRKIHTDLVSDVLLQSVEIHEAIAEYLSRANIKIDPNVVQKILGINKTAAENFARRIGFIKASNVVANKRCTGLMVNGKRCNIKVNVTVFSATNVLCNMHELKILPNPHVMHLLPGRYTLTATGITDYCKADRTFLIFAEIPGVGYLLGTGNKANMMSTFKINDLIIVRSAWKDAICAMIEDPDIGPARTVYASAMQEIGMKMETMPAGEKMLIKTWTPRIQKMRAKSVKLSL